MLTWVCLGVQFRPQTATWWNTNESNLAYAASENPGGSVRIRQEQSFKVLQDFKSFWAAQKIFTAQTGACCPKARTRSNLVEDDTDTWTLAVPAFVVCVHVPAPEPQKSAPATLCHVILS